MARRNGSLTLTESVFLELRKDILSGRLAPETPLMPGELREHFHVSIAVIREALTRLAAQGLALQSPNYGFTVIPLTFSDLNNIIEARSINEGAALKLSISKGDVVWESNILALHHQLEQLSESSINGTLHVDEQWSDLHCRFHYALIKACENPVLLEICSRLWNKSELYRSYSVSRNNNRPAAAEHKALMQAVIARDTELALTLYNEHIKHTVETLGKL